MTPTPFISLRLSGDSSCVADGLEWGNVSATPQKAISINTYWPA